MKNGCLYVYEHDGKTIGAVSVVPENELDGMECWTQNEAAREFARVTVSKEYSGRGFAGIMVRELLSVLSSQGCKSVHILVAKCNKAALRTYEKLGFEFVGECFMYGNDYYMAEKLL